MAWLERLNDRQTRRLARDMTAHAIDARDLAQEHMQQLAQQTAQIARTAAHQMADYGRDRGADLVRERAERYAHRAGEVAGQLAEYGRNEGTMLAQAAATKARRAGQAVKADPVPVIVGAVGAILLVNLFLGRRSR